MPIFGLGLHVIVALYFAVHAIRHGQNMSWLFVLFAFPGLGSVVYFAAVYWPEMRHSRGGAQAKRVLTNLVDPNRALREARHAYEMVATVDNRLKLAAALLDTGDSAEALQLYTEAATGPFAHDPALLSGMARAQFATGNPAGAVSSLETLFNARPEQRRQAMQSLLYARALAACGAAGTREAFEAALVQAGDAEPKCQYADWLAARSDSADQVRARALYEEIVKDSRHWHNSHSKAINREWLRRAKAALSQGA